MQRDASYLADVLAAARDIREFAQGVSFADFEERKSLRYAMLHSLMIIGEAVSKVSPELKSRHPAVPWARVAGLRHRIVHDYAGLDLILLWGIITEMVPALQAQIQQIAAAEFPDESQ